MNEFILATISMKVLKAIEGQMEDVYDWGLDKDNDATRYFTLGAIQGALDVLLLAREEVGEMESYEKVD